MAGRGCQETGYRRTDILNICNHFGFAELMVGVVVRVVSFALQCHKSPAELPYRFGKSARVPEHNAS